MFSHFSLALQPMAMAVPPLIALIVLLAPALAEARRITHGNKRDSRKAAARKEELKQCVWENTYTPDWDTQPHILRATFGFPAKGCGVKCRALMETTTEVKAKLANVKFSKYEVPFIKHIKEVKAMKSNGMCTCQNEDGDQLVPTFTATDLCTKEDCWSFHKQIFRVEQKVNAWMPTADSCTRTCEEGSCESVQFASKATDDDLKEVKALQKEQKEGADLTDKQKAKIDAFKIFVDEAERAARRLANMATWHMPPNARCSKPCKTGLDDTPFIVDPWICIQKGDVVPESECEKSVGEAPPRQECANVGFCRAAWSSEPVGSIRPAPSGKATSAQGDVLPIDGAWIPVGQPVYSGILFSSTTSTSSKLSMKETGRHWTDRYRVSIVGTGESAKVRYVDDYGVEHIGTSTDGWESIDWDTDFEGWEKWVRRKPQEGFDGVWVAEESNEYKGTIEPTDNGDERIFKSLSMDGTATEHKAIIDGEKLQLHGMDGTDLADKVLMEGVLEWDQDTGADKLVWTSTEDNDDQMAPGTWVRMGEPTVAEDSFGKCSQPCVGEDEQVTGKQERSVTCFVETGGPFSGKWEQRTDHVCAELMGEAHVKPAEERTCDPVPPKCGDWIVICRRKMASPDGTRVIAPDDECFGEKPKI